MIEHKPILPFKMTGSASVDLLSLMELVKNAEQAARQRDDAEYRLEVLSENGSRLFELMYEALYTSPSPSHDPIGSQKAAIKLISQMFPIIQASQDYQSIKHNLQ